MNDEQVKALRAEFPPSQVGKLPKAGMQLDYVGHGAVTDRLLDVDPEWTWTPYALDARGLPLFDTNDKGDPIGLWINLTVCGVTRPGYGSCSATQQDAEKVLIGDALRNAAMRFGVALFLWIKGQAEDDEKHRQDGPRTRRQPAAAAPQLADHNTHEALRAAASELAAELKPAFAAWMQEHGVPPFKQADRLTMGQVSAALDEIARLQRSQSSQTSTGTESPPQEPSDVPASGEGSASTAPSGGAAAEDTPAPPKDPARLLEDAGMTAANTPAAARAALNAAKDRRGK